jgi:hypothetical protein
MNTDKKNWKQFELYPSFMAIALVEDGQVKAVKLISNVQRHFYHSYYQDAVKKAGELFATTNSIN